MMLPGNQMMFTTRGAPLDRDAMAGALGIQQAPPEPIDDEAKANAILMALKKTLDASKQYQAEVVDENSK